MGCQRRSCDRMQLIIDLMPSDSFVEKQAIFGLMITFPCFYIVSISQKNLPMQLYYDSNQIGDIHGPKVMVAAPVFYLFMSHYLFQILRIAKGLDHLAPRLNDLGIRLPLYGVLSLLSVNFLADNPLAPVLAWGTLLWMLVVQACVFLRQTGQKYHNIGLLVYYVLLLGWAILVLFYFVLRAH